MVAPDTGPASYNRYVRIILTSTHVNSVLDSVLIRAVPGCTLYLLDCRLLTFKTCTTTHFITRSWCMLLVHMDAKREQDGGDYQRVISPTGLKGLRQVSIHSLCSQEICLWRIKYLVYRTIKYDEYTIKYNGQNNSQ